MSDEFSKAILTDPTICFSLLLFLDQPTITSLYQNDFVTQVMIEGEIFGNFAQTMMIRDWGEDLGIELQIKFDQLAPTDYFGIYDYRWVSLHRFVNFETRLVDNDSIKYNFKFIKSISNFKMCINIISKVEYVHFI